MSEPHEPFLLIVGTVAKRLDGIGLRRVVAGSIKSSDREQMERFLEFVRNARPGDTITVFDALIVRVMTSFERQAVDNMKRHQPGPSHWGVAEQAARAIVSVCENIHYKAPETRNKHVHEVSIAINTIIEALGLMRGR